MSTTLVDEVRDAHRVSFLPASCTHGQCSCVRSPYRQRITNRIGTGRDTYILALMNVYAIVIQTQNDYYGNFYVTFGFYDTSYNYLSPVVTVPLSISDIVNNGLNATVAVAIANSAAGLSYTVLSTSWSVAAQAALAFNYPALAVNTARQASTTRNAMVNATVSISSALSLTGGAQGTVTLQYADNNTFTTNLVTVQSFTNGNTGTLTLGLNTTQIENAALTGLIPANKYYRLLTTNVTGTPTYGTPVIQEVLL